MLQYRYSGILSISRTFTFSNHPNNVRSISEVVMRKSVGRWYVEYFGADDVLITEFFHYEEDAKAFQDLVGGYIDYDHYRVIAEIEGVA